MKTRVFSFIFVAMFMLCGCAIPIAPFYDQPLPQSQLDQLKQGVTQEDVVRLLGTPDTTRQEGRLWYYGGTRPSVLLIGTNNAGSLLDYRWIEIGFDADKRLLYVAPQDSKTGCVPSGHCLRHWWVELNEKNILDSSVITDASENDQLAKKFTPPEGGCALYFYLEPLGFLDMLGAGTSPGVKVNDAHSPWLDGDTYMLFNVMPGTVSIRYGKLIEKTWECDVGSIQFVVKKESFETKPNPDELQFVDESVGRREIEKRSLLLAP